MKIAVKDIADEGLELFEEVNADRMGLVVKRRLAYETPVRIRVVATRTGRRDVRVLGDAQAQVRWTCSRCLEGFTKPLRQKFDLSFSNKDESSVIDPTDMIREEILLSYPIQAHCKNDCKGLCPHCGHNNNQGPCGCGEDNASPFGKLKDLIK